jgi:hypothetical protein
MNFGLNYRNKSILINELMTFIVTSFKSVSFNFAAIKGTIEKK